MELLELSVDDPATGEIFTTRPVTPYAAALEAVERARVAQRAWRRSAPRERAALVERFCDRLLAAKERVAAEITGQMGKPLSQARGEVDTCVARARHMAAIAADALADLHPAGQPGYRRRVAREPLGVVLVIAPWNYPLLTAVNVVAPAVLAGNAVLIKHSSRTPLCGEHFADAFRDAGAPEGLVTALHSDHRVTEALIRERQIDHVALTGSVGAGRRIYGAAASALIGCGLELGGKDPAYIAADADLDAAAAGVAGGAFFNAGQSCCAVERVYVHRACYDEVVDRLRAAARAEVFGDPRDPGTTMGPMAQEGAPAALEQQVKDAVAKGAQLLEGGAPTQVGGRGRYFQPTLLTGCTHSMEVMVEESFGPLLPVMAVDSDEEALWRMNDSRFGLTASIWSRDPERAERMGPELETGTVFLNRCDYVDPALPWVGVKHSGLGCTLSELGLHALTRPKSYHLRG